ncbi:hypothetical protein EBO15_08220 [Actinomadura harenae]|uniref:DUF6745 domain-containing protein n=1 Tax=Actinomadura harenae TaxID=2483351 RepID=A0A3M2M937_9ACTN|nr:hypothetical protein EBO15_08220 [Actinomadura harenae]
MRTAADARRDALETVRLATRIRDEWIDEGLSALPADRPAAEAAISELYARVRRPAPRFVWVPSPAAAPTAGATTRPMPPPRFDALPDRHDGWPAASLIAALHARLDLRVGDVIARRRRVHGYFHFERWRTDAPEQAVREGADAAFVVSEALLPALTRTVRDSLLMPLRALLNAEAGDPSGYACYGQHGVHKAGAYDVWRRTGLLRLRPEDSEQLDVWAAVARSCGWWWPGDEECVVSERPVDVRTDSAPDGGRRPHSVDGQAVRYADGWGFHAVNGTRVPEWVITDPTPERIAAEPNVEIRRCAIERLGWDAYTELAGLRLVGSAPDPGNPGSELCLFDLPGNTWGGPARLLLTVNGSVERDGTRRRYGLTVPFDLPDPLAAAAWTYGLDSDQYARLQRRT